MISVQRYISADDTDALVNTDLGAFPYNGVLSLWVASTQNDTLLTLTKGGQSIIRNGRPPLRTNGIPDVSADPPLAVMTGLTGQKIVLNIDIITAATVGIFAVMLP